MKNIIASLVMVIALVVSVVAQKVEHNAFHGTISTEVGIVKGIATPVAKLYATYGEKTKLGAYCWAQASRYWQQFYCGPTYAPKAWLQFGGAVGAQAGPKRLQLGGFVWTGKTVKGKFIQNLLVVEKAGTWFRNLASLNVNKKVTLGIVTQRYQGTGPRVEIKLARSWTLATEAKIGSTATVSIITKYSF